ncbi:MAG: DNA internalization-related competence protein ComEC/Rec2 [Xenophilus sp.]
MAAYAALGLGAAAGLWALRRAGWPPARAFLPAVLCGIALGLAATGLRAGAQLSGALPAWMEGRDVEVAGVIAQMPRRGNAGLQFRLDVESAQWPAAQAEGPAPRVPPRIALGWYAAGGGRWGREAEAPGPLPPVHAGERWRFTVRLRAPHGTLNPHGFDYELWLWEQGVQATGTVRSGARDVAPQRLDATARHPVERAREAVRDAILERVADRQRAGVVAALVTGDQAAIDRADWDVFRATGVAHLMSISGLHVTMFAWLAGGLVGALWRRSTGLMRWLPAQQAALAGGLALAAAYALFSGWGVPAQRTVWMLALAALLRLGARRWPWPLAWLLVCAGVVALDPWALMQAGFWLSFVAVGVLFAADAGAPPAGTGSARRLAAKLARLLREQAVVTLALAPLGLLLFQQVSLVGLLANLAAIPWVTLVVTPLAMLGVLLPPLWDAAACSVGLLGHLLQWLAAWPGATFSTAAPALWAGVAGVLGGVLLAMRLPPSLRLMGLPLLLPVLLWQAPRPPAGEFELLAADVGQGNAVLVRTARHTLLYDAGPHYGEDSDAGHRVLVPLLRALDERVDTLLLSHRDTDHTGGAGAVLAMQPGAMLLGTLEPGHPLQALRPQQPCAAGLRWEWDGVRFAVLHPPPGTATEGVRPNTVSCVLRVDNGRASALLAGDIERPQERALAAADADALRADVLLVPHHGSRTSSSPAFLAAVQPRLAIVQAGWRNRFGHPAPEVLARLRERGAQVADSPRCGALHWRSTQPDAVPCEREARRRYWHHRPLPAP